jgi:hypothetical protein
MSVVFILDAARTIALGGVATGNMKAYEQHRVAGIMKYRGWIFIATACKNQYTNTLTAFTKAGKKFILLTPHDPEFVENRQ